MQQDEALIAAEEDADALAKALELLAGHFLMIATGLLPNDSYADDFNASQAVLAAHRQRKGGQE